MRASQDIIIIVLSFGWIKDTKIGRKSVCLNCNQDEYNNKHPLNWYTHIFHSWAKVGSQVHVTHVIMRVVCDDNHNLIKIFLTATSPDIVLHKTRTSQQLRTTWGVGPLLCMADMSPIFYSCCFYTYTLNTSWYILSNFPPMLTRPFQIILLCCHISHPSSPLPCSHTSFPH
jgi:hypothetical protein